MQISIVAQRTLYDIRDSKPYIIRKLADNNCWMVSNLAIANVELTPRDSDVKENVNLPAAVSNTTARVSYEKSYISSDGLNSVFLYNWHAAVAVPDGVSIENRAERDVSVCSKEWRLPSASGSKSFFNLLDTVYKVTSGGTFVNGYDYNSILGYPLNYTLTGMIDVTGIFGASGLGSYWTNTPYEENDIWTYNLDFRTPTQYPSPNHCGAQDRNTKSRGFALRCVNM